MKYIKLKEFKSGIMLMEISNPNELNALNIKLLQELDNSLSEIEKQTKIKVLIIRGDGNKSFVAGANIKEMFNMSKEQAYNHSKMGQKIFSKIENFRKPVIAAINGYALGGGCELSLACHIRYASKNAYIGQPEVKLGIIAGFGGTQRLSKVVGKGKAMEILLTGKMYNALECFEMGLIDGLFDNDDELIKKSIETANLISNNSPKALSKTIELINKSFDLKFQDGFDLESIEFGKLFEEKDSLEGMSAFIEKRKAKF